MTTCIYGGTFNPVHKGHIRLAQRGKAFLKPDRMLLIPSFLPPHKQHESLVSVEDRLHMASLAAKHIGCEVCDIEIRRKDVSYSVHTLTQLKQMGYGDLYFLMGSDMFLCLEKWYEFQKVLTLCTPVTAPRTEGELPLLLCHAQRLKDLYGADSIVCDFAVTEVSSTFLREQLEAGKDADGLIPDDIFAYIQEKGLYKKKG